MPKIAPTPAVNPIAKAPQKVTRPTEGNTGAPAARAERLPNNARQASDEMDTMGTIKCGGTVTAAKSGKTAPAMNVAAEASAA
jgi:hypothetical protein